MPRCWLSSISSIICFLFYFYFLGLVVMEDISAKLSPVCPAKRNANSLLYCVLNLWQINLIWFDLIITSWRIRGVPKTKIASWCCKSTPSGENFHLCLSSYTYQFTYQILASSLNYFLGYEGGPKIQDGVAVVRMRHLAEKIFNGGKAPMHVYSYTEFQLSNLINSRDTRGSKSKMAQS